INVNLKEEDFPPDLRSIATSLRLQLGHPVDRAELAVALLRELDFEYARLGEGKFPMVAAEWAEHCSTLGRQVSIRTGERVIRGRAEAVDEDGALLVRTEHGHLEHITGGDVSLESETTR